MERNAHGFASELIVGDRFYFANDTKKRVYTVTETTKKNIHYELDERPKWDVRSATLKREIVFLRNIYDR